MNKIIFNMDAAIEKYEQIIAMTEPTTSTEQKSADKRTRGIELSRTFSHVAGSWKVPEPGLVLSACQDFLVRASQS